ncbi:MAG: vWA domain-containing protein [Pyrinomonadaceae bacterium]
MNSGGFALKVLGVELLLIALCGVLVFLYASSVRERQRRALAAQAEASVPRQNADAKAFAAQYQRAGKSVSDLLSAVSLRKETDLIVFVVDTSQSMNDDRQELRENIKKIMTRYKGKSLELVDFTDTTLITGEPTQDAGELQHRLDQSRDLGGPENSYNALIIAAAKAGQKFKHPAIILMTDAAPNDDQPGSSSHATMDQAASALNAADAELQVFAAFDYQEYLAGGSAATTDLYPQLLKKVKAGGEIHLLKRDNFDPNSLSPPTRQ